MIEATSLRSSIANRMTGMISALDGFSSKSIQNRILLLSLIAIKRLVVKEPLDSEDTEVMLTVLKTLGIKIYWKRKDLILERASGGKLRRQAQLFFGNSGTTARFVSSVLIIRSGNYFLKGSLRMHKRPFGSLIEALRIAGANVQCCFAPGFMPLIIRPACTLNNSTGISIRGDTSSQFITAVLFCLTTCSVYNPRKLIINVQDKVVSKSYISTTLLILERLGTVIDRKGWSCFLEFEHKAFYKKELCFTIEKDMSSLSYFVALGVISTGMIKNIGSLTYNVQGDALFGSIIFKYGCKFLLSNDGLIISNKRTKINPFCLDCNLIPDASMTLLVLAAFSNGTCYLNQLLSWRFKETDRLLAMAIELRKLNLIVIATLNLMQLCQTDNNELQTTANFSTYGDHRMAMCYNVLCLAGLDLRINSPECTGKTFYNYFYIFNNLSHQTNEQYYLH